MFYIYTTIEYFINLWYFYFTYKMLTIKYYSLIIYIYWLYSFSEGSSLQQIIIKMYKFIILFACFFSFIFACKNERPVSKESDRQYLLPTTEVAKSLTAMIEKGGPLHDTLSAIMNRVNPNTIPLDSLRKSVICDCVLSKDTAFQKHFISFFSPQRQKQWKKRCDQLVQSN